jgi:hypothetical protein
VVPQQRVTRSGVTPQPELPIQPSSRRTPATRSRGGSSSAKSTQKRNTPTPTPTANDANRSANTSAKRRKLDAAQDVRSSSPARSTRSRPTRRRDLYDLEKEEPAPELVEGQTPGQILDDNEESGDELDQVQPTEAPKSFRVTDPDVGRDDEITESPRNAPGSGQSQQASFGKTKMPGARLFGTVGEATPPTRQGAPVAEMGPKLANRRSSRNHETSSAANEIDELSPDRTNRSRLVFQQEDFSDIEGDEQEEAEAIDDMEAAERLQNKRKRKTGRGVKDSEPEREEPERDDEEQEEAEQSAERIIRPMKAVKQREKPRGKASPAVQRQPKKSKPKSTSKKSGETIPIIVHRLTKPVIYGEDDTDADILNEDVPFSKRSGVNAVDVLSQFCEEIVETGLEALEEGGSNAEDPTTRREYRTKLRAVEAFQEELRMRLLELVCELLVVDYSFYPLTLTYISFMANITQTVILDADYLLNKRVRAAQKEKIQLREDLLRLRTEREQLALRMDEVRIKHENSSKEAQVS